MQEKNSYDVRGRQSNIFRLYFSDKEGLIHMLFYRLGIILAIITAFIMLVSIYKTGSPLTRFSEQLIFIIGILMIPQLFESLKAFALIASNGVVFGRLNASFVEFGVRKSGAYGLYKVIPYIVTIVWAIALVWLGVLWSV